jgi:hypothetical protein
LQKSAWLSLQVAGVDPGGQMLSSALASAENVPPQMRSLPSVPLADTGHALISQELSGPFIQPSKQVHAPEQLFFVLIPQGRGFTKLTIGLQVPRAGKPQGEESLESCGHC